MKVKLLVWAVGALAVAAGCGGGSSGEQKPAKVAKGDAGAGAEAAQPDAAPAEVAQPGAAPAATASGGALAKCSDGGRFAGARFTASEARFCLEDDETKARSCWRADLTASGAATPIAELGAAAEGAVDVAALQGPMRDERPAPPGSPPPAGRHVKVSSEGVEVCGGGDAACAPFALTPPVNLDDERTTPIAAELSASGARLAVVRGSGDGMTPVTLEVYDRAAGKKLGSVRPRSPCAFVNRFAGETAVFTEWRCTDEGQAHLLISPAGKQIARIPGEFPHDAVSVRLEGDRWAFLSFRALSIYDVGSGKRLAELPIRDEAVATAHGVLHVFEMQRVELVSYDAAGKRVGSWRAPTCRFEWERETLGPLALEMPTQQVLKLLGQPAKKTKMTSEAWVSTWTYKDGAVVGIEADPDPNSDRPVLPFRVVYAAITAPSPLRTKAGIGVGSSRAELMAAYGAHVVASRSREGEIFIGNDAPHDSDGMIVTLRDEKITRIELGRAGWVDWPSDDDDLDAEDEE